MPKPKKIDQTLEDQKAKEELKKYDTSRLSDRMVERLRNIEETGEYTLIEDVDAFYDRFKR